MLSSVHQPHPISSFLAAFGFSLGKQRFTGKNSHEDNWTPISEAILVTKSLSTALLLFVLSLLTACDQLSSQPCQIKVNGICYDTPKARNPPLTASWQIIDVDTKKPIPGVWISFYWKKFPNGQQSGGSCARNVIGQTDANGRFSDTAKDGSWMFAEVGMFKSGYQPIRYDRLLEQTYITDKYNISQEFVGKYPAWEEELKQMGYRLNTISTTNSYFKNFELNSEYSKIMAAAWYPEGERQYWVSTRSFPSEQFRTLLGAQCHSRKLGRTDPNAEFVGYDGFNLKPSREQKEYGYVEIPGPDKIPWEIDRAKAAIRYICDKKWDSVPADFNFTPAPLILMYASQIQIDKNGTSLVDVIPEYYNESRSYGHSRALTRQEQVRACVFFDSLTNNMENKP